MSWSMILATPKPIIREARRRYWEEKKEEENELIL